MVSLDDVSMAGNALTNSDHGHQTIKRESATAPLKKTRRGPIRHFHRSTNSMS